jgi:hypothetical protein
MNLNDINLKDLEIDLNEININEMMTKIKSVVSKNKDLVQLMDKMEKDFKTDVENLNHINTSANLELLKKWRQG